MLGCRICKLLLGGALGGNFEFVSRFRKENEGEDRHQLFKFSTHQNHYPWALLLATSIAYISPSKPSRIKQAYVHSQLIKVTEGWI